jgi:hypothetical protein
MGTLIVQTLTDRNSIAAFVASAEGMPALGLGLANFKLRVTLPGADGSHLVIKSVEPSKLRGFYVLDLAPVSPAPRRRGLYVFDLVVEHGENRGEAMSSVILT